MIPIVSKQIAYVQYDDQASQMIVQYHTGLQASFADVKQDDYQTIASSTNSYDSLMRLTRSRYAQAQPSAVE
ncbi:KTSC domain-containing protein [Paenibacillus hexagrammi]|uniref:KTSC domain-containing protein n=1 Tax=Paenibacillus hexagrammi TaxID=2908839 RepID=A0ABY3SS89_9BACL|nr:KTSC domain-containing protein [Paenibacillus sp. YPD9-1]UJF36255.1 KTSC domain-containing protein [Paenibacillus sp. YPD9-1]